MAIPEEDFDWATTQLSETVTNNEGDSVVAINRVEPSTSFKQTGILARGRVIRSYINYVLFALGRWVLYLREGEIGDFKVMPPTATVASVQERFNGTWADRGTDTLAGQSVRIFEKTG